jgi:hypothetical protein
MRLTVIWIGLATGSFLYQAATNHDWQRAVDNIWTSAAALIAVWAVMKIERIGFCKQDRP